MAPRKQPNHGQKTPDGEFAEAWRPEPGEIVAGEIVDMTIGASVYGRYPILTINDNVTERPVAVHGFHTTLFNKLSEWAPRVGEHITITYGGQKLTKTEGQTAHLYTVKVSGRELDIWGNLSGAAPSARAAAQEMPPTAVPSSVPLGDSDIPF